MKERPILFSAPMVRALLDGSKTQTRRIIKGQAPDWATFTDEEYADGREFFMVCGEKEPSGLRPILAAAHCPYGQAGDRLWVRETFSDIYGAGGDEARRKEEVMYRADGETDPYVIGGRWTPSIHMPRWASRILLEIVSVRVERLQDCSRKDAIAEGIHRYEHVWRDSEYPLDDVAYEPVKGWATRYSCPIQAYQALWESINGAGNWDANPWVWVVEFKRVTP